jgi:lincosamide nucleotidyltransferase A/C/D/E
MSSPCARIRATARSEDEEGSPSMKPSDSVEQKSHAEMSGDAVIELLQLFEQHGIEVFVDGGWGVDALLGIQTRSHADLDLALQHKDVPKLRTLLEARRYQDVPRSDTRDCNFVMGDDKGHEVDIHSYTFDAHGTLVFGVAYPLASLTGTGTIQGYPVKCISPEWMVEFHSGYALDENDYHDVAALCERFGIALPAEYERFTRE